MIKRILIIGGGAAGLFAACRCAERGLSVTVFEHSRLFGMKLGITGKGRCNLTNNCTPQEYMKNLTKNGRFMYSAVNLFTPSDTMAYFEDLGVPLKTERGNRVFPVSDKATDIVLALKNHAVSLGAKLRTKNVTGIKAENGRVSSVLTDDGVFSDFDDVMLCTGGLSYPVTGSDGSGLKLASSLGHTVVSPTPSLSALVCRESCCAEMQGLSLKNIGIKVRNSAKKIIYEDFGEMLFTHFGISGPVILSSSAYMRPMKDGEYTVSIDLKPALDEKALDKRLLSDFEKYKNRIFENAFCDLLPSKMHAPFVSLCNIAKDRQINSVTAPERRMIIGYLKAFPLTVKAFRPIEEAIVTSGGVSVSEINPKTMQSKLYDNLYFAGEITDVDALTGGFNLQTAFSQAEAASLALYNK